MGVARLSLVIALVAASWAAAACLVLGLVSFAQLPAELRSGSAGRSGILGQRVEFVVLGGAGLPDEGVERAIADLSTANVVVPSLVALAATVVAALRRRGRPPRGVLWVALGLQVAALLLELNALGLRSGGLVVLYNFFRNHPGRALLLAASTALVLWVALAATRADREAAQPAATSGV